MLRKPVAAALTLAVIPLGFGAPEMTSKSLAFATYKERVGRVTVLVGSFPAALSDGEPYIPLQIAVGLRGKGPRVIVTAESFHLIDQDANVYPMASWQEILEQDRAFLFKPQILEAYTLGHIVGDRNPQGPVGRGCRGPAFSAPGWRLCRAVRRVCLELDRQQAQDPAPDEPGAGPRDA